MDMIMNTCCAPRRGAAALGILLALATVPAVAQQQQAHDSGLYIGFGLGAGNYSLKAADLRTNEVARTLGAAGVMSTDVKKTAAASKLSIGYNFNRHFGTELTSTGLDSIDLEYRDRNSGLVAAKAKYSVGALALAGVGRYEFDNRFVLMSKAGIAYTGATLDYALARPNSTLVTADPNVTKTNFYWGASVGYRFNARWVATLDYDDFGSLGNANTTGRSTMRTLTANAQYRF